MCVVVCWGYFVVCGCCACCSCLLFVVCCCRLVPARCVLSVGCGLTFVCVFVVAACSPFRVIWRSCVLSLLDCVVNPGAVCCVTIADVG